MNNKITHTNMYGDVFAIGDEVIMYPYAFPTRKVVNNIYLKDLFFERHPDPVNIVDQTNHAHANSCCTIDRYEEEIKK